MNVTVQLLADNLKMGASLSENISKGNAKRRSRRKKKQATIKDEVDSIGQPKTDGNSTEKNLVEGIHSVGHIQMDTEPIENIAEGNVTGKRKKKRKRNKKAKIKDEDQSTDQLKTDTLPIENLAEGNVLGKRKRKRRRGKKREIKDAVQSVDQIQINKEAETESEVQSMSHAASMSNSHLSNEPTLQVDQNEKFEYGLSEVSDEFILNEQKGSSKGRSVVSACDVMVDTDFASVDVKEEKCLHLETAPITSNRRKLLVLDLNGLLADILMPAPKHCSGDTHISGREIFKRPFCRDFLEFCFQNFDVGIWSSRAKRIVDRVVDYLLGDLQHKLKFCWDRSRCTQTGFKTLDNQHKPLVCKELRKIWVLGNPFLRWKKGDYDESNTLLLDDSPYKALLNPLHTAIFPHPYCYEDRNDNLLGPNGDLQIYLKGLLKYENVHKYVEQHPFGQRPIDEQHVSWEFYREVLHSVSK